MRRLQLNSRYLPQLQQVLAMPQSIGIVGGRPGSSLYFMGCQDSHVLYMDPHHVQQVSCCHQQLALSRPHSLAGAVMAYGAGSLLGTLSCMILELARQACDAGCRGACRHGILLLLLSALHEPFRHRPLLGARLLLP